MRNEPVTMNDFAESVREELQNDLGVLFPGIKVVVQQVDKIQGDSYLGIQIDRQDGMASPVLNLEPHFKDMKTFKPYEKVVSDILIKAETVLRDMPQITLNDLNDYSQLKDNLIMQVISVKGNEERLADITKHPNYYLPADADDRNTFDMEKFLNRKLKLHSNEEYTVVEA